MSIHKITPAALTTEIVSGIVSERKTLVLSAESVQKIEKCYNYLHNKLESTDEPIYGINTGFGSLCNTRINKEDLSKLQENLVKSHACGMGEEVPQEITRIMMLLKIQGLSLGHSGVSLSTVNRLIELYNKNIFPVIYQQGSLGASGDLAPLAHLSLVLIGEGEVYDNENKKKTIDVLRDHKLEPLRLEAKEGLALLNGTQFMSAYASWLVIRMKHLTKLADLCGAISLEAFDGRIDPFNALIHQVRNHDGQRITAENFRTLLEGSELIKKEKVHVQDPYSFRCIPQVHGASRDAMRYIESVIEKEISSVTDNPTLFPDEDLILSGGNFHGQPLAIALDMLAIAAAELGSISERRTYKLISGQRGLPPFLASEAGLNSGFMIPQYTAASIVSQNKQLATPASIDTIDSSNGQEDHVSMGANAATKAFRVVENLEKILSIELLNGAQALEYRKPSKTSPVLENFITDFRREIPFIREDVYLHELMVKAQKYIGKIQLPVIKHW
jgi:histidine ammonia-lyase